jgi:low affinity Fe/Cu permease
VSDASPGLAAGLEVGGDPTLAELVAALDAARNEVVHAEHAELVAFEAWRDACAAKRAAEAVAECAFDRYQMLRGNARPIARRDR